MKVGDYLKGQLVDFVATYQRYWSRAINACIGLSMACFLVAALLFRYSAFDVHTSMKQVSLLSYFFNRYSKGDTYSIVDLVKTVFVFFVSIFGVGLYRVRKDGDEKLGLRGIMGKIGLKDVVILLVTFLFTGMMDIGLVRLHTLVMLNVSNTGLANYISALIFNVRIYAPLLLFALAVCHCVRGTVRINAGKLLGVYISLWLFNEFAYEVSLWVRTHLFGLVAIPVGSSERFYIIESLLGIPLIAFYMLGYASAMMYPMGMRIGDDSGRMEQELSNDVNEEL